VTRTHRRTLRRTSPLVLLLLSLVASACGAAPGSADRDRAALSAARRSAPATYVVAITIDGFNPSSLAKLGRKRAGGFTRMIENGASTLNARTAYERTETMPDHSSVFTGRRVLHSHAHHVTFNDDDARTDIHTVAGEYVPSMFDVVHDRGRRTLFFSGKEKFAFWNRSWDSTHGGPDRVGKDDGRDKISAYHYGTAADMVRALVRSLHDRPAALSYLHVPLPDKAGHAHGFMSPAYLEAVESSGALVGRILDAVRGDADLRGRTTVVLTADHGGGGLAKNHSDPTLLRNYRVPFMVWGAGVEAGADLYSLNKERVRPGDGRPGYGSRPPIRNLDLASMVTTLLGYPAVPGGLTGVTPLRAS
jgi:predicted AlkP superfamily pyrophosphatase or phosphodiesterase